VVLAFTLDEPQASGVRVELGGDTW